MTKIPWTNKSWNPVVGCTKIATGCKNCYAERMAYRLSNMPQKAEYAQVVNGHSGWNGKVLCREDKLDKPLHWRKPRKIFVCSMSDLFHEKVPFEFIEKVISVIEQCPQHDFQILTKRPLIMLEYFNGLGKRFELSCCPNLWLGTSISTQADLEKAWQTMRGMPAAIRFISLEPMLERVIFPKLKRYEDCLDCRDAITNHACQQICATGHRINNVIDWVIIGCESGPGARLCSIEDIRDAVRQCKEANVPVFVKQVPVNGKCSKKPEEWLEEWPQEYPK